MTSDVNLGRTLLFENKRRVAAIHYELTFLSPQFSLVFLFMFFLILASSLCRYWTVYWILTVSVR